MSSAPGKHRSPAGAFAPPAKRAAAQESRGGRDGDRPSPRHTGLGWENGCWGWKDGGNVSGGAGAAHPLHPKRGALLPPACGCRQPGAGVPGSRGTGEPGCRGAGVPRLGPGQRGGLWVPSGWASPSCRAGRAMEVGWEGSGLPPLGTGDAASLSSPPSASIPFPNPTPDLPGIFLCRSPSCQLGSWPGPRDGYRVTPCSGSKAGGVDGAGSHCSSPLSTPPFPGLHPPAQLPWSSRVAALRGDTVALLGPRAVEAAGRPPRQGW